jgi:hypothetical protein
MLAGFRGLIRPRRSCALFGIDRRLQRLRLSRRLGAGVTGRNILYLSNVVCW